MTKVSLELEDIKALASDSRIEILKALDGKRLNLKDLSKITKLNKATLHVHLTRLLEAGFIKKKEREGHKWVFYKLSWKGECLLHPENIKIVVLFTTTFITLCVGVIQLFWYVKGKLMNFGYNIYNLGEEVVVTDGDSALSNIDVSNIKDIPSNIPDFLMNLIATNSEKIENGLTSQDTSSILPFSTGGDINSIPIDGDISWVGSLGSEDITAPLEQGTKLVVDKSEGVINAVYQDPTFLYVGLTCFIIFAVVISLIIWILWKKRKTEF